MRGAPRVKLFSKEKKRQRQDPSFLGYSTSGTTYLWSGDDDDSAVESATDIVEINHQGNSTRQYLQKLSCIVHHDNRLVREISERLTSPRAKRQSNRNRAASSTPTHARKRHFFFESSPSLRDNDSNSTTSSSESGSMVGLIRKPEKSNGTSSSWLPSPRSRRRPIAECRMGLLDHVDTDDDDDDDQSHVRGYDLEGVSAELCNQEFDQENQFEVPLWVVDQARAINEEYSHHAEESRDDLGTSREPLVESARFSSVEPSPCHMSPAEKQLSARRSLQERLSEQRALRHKTRLRRSKQGELILKNLSTVAELPSEEERTQGSRSDSSRRKRCKGPPPPIDVVSYDSSWSETYSVTAVDDDDKLSLEEEFLILPDGTRSLIVVEMEI